MENIYLHMELLYIKIYVQYKITKKIDYFNYHQNPDLYKIILQVFAIKQTFYYNIFITWTLITVYRWLYLKLFPGFFKCRINYISYYLYIPITIASALLYYIYNSKVIRWVYRYIAAKPSIPSILTNSPKPA